MINKLHPEIFSDGIISAPLPDRVIKYLRKYISGRWNLKYTSGRHVNNAVVIPAIGEYENIKTLLASLASCDNKYFEETLFIFVINNPSSAGADIKENNKSSLLLLQKIIDRIRGNKFIDSVIESGLRIGIIDACTVGNELPELTAGAGHARKIGMDLALTVFDYLGKSKKILVCLDADCIVESNYLTEIVDRFNETNMSAAVIKYSHSKSENPQIQKAITCYEIYLNYYELGLKYARSPYAFHTIGSALACDYESYIKAEGMNKRKAGEDFYFLEKLLKNSGVYKIITTEVHPAPRMSYRVPFGTGRRISRFLAGEYNEYMLYNPASFYILKDWLQLYLYGEELSAGEYLDKAFYIHAGLGNFLKDEKFPAVMEKIASHSPGKEQLYKQKIRWFDGFKTLKLIHYLRDKEFPLINMFDALDELFGKMGIKLPERNGKEIPVIRIQNEYLEFLKRHTN